MGSALRFHAVVCDKQVLVRREMDQRGLEPGYRYQPDRIYDGLIQTLFSGFHRLADTYEVCVARRGARDRNEAIRIAIEDAERDFQEQFGFARGASAAWRILISSPQQTVCLQAADYCLWALQRFYEGRLHGTTGERIREDRFLKL